MYKGKNGVRASACVELGENEPHARSLRNGTIPSQSSSFPTYVPMEVCPQFSMVFSREKEEIVIDVGPLVWIDFTFDSISTYFICGVFVLF